MPMHDIRDQIDKLWRNLMLYMLGECLVVRGAL